MESAMHLGRRLFLQSAAALLLAQACWQEGSPSATTAIAASPPALRALLIGINHYPHLTLVPPLAGCLSDVERVKVVLMERFGLGRDRLTVLTDAAATLASVQEELAELQQLGDPILVYFSGYGSLWQQQPTLLLANADNSGADSLALAELLQLKSLYLWLDTRFSPPPTHGAHLRWRYAPLVPNATAPLPTDSRNLMTAWDLGVEGTIDGTTAGLFTATLTHYLVSLAADHPLDRSLMYAADDLRTHMGTEVHFAMGSLGLLDTEGESWDALVQNGGHDRSLNLWCGGLSPWLLAHLSPHSRLESASGDSVVELSSINGIVAQGTATAPLPPGDRLYEKLRRLPRNLSLKVALDSQLEKIERVDVVNALASQANVTVINGSEELPDVVITKTSAVGSYGLQWPVGTLLQESCTSTNEAAKAGMRRLEPFFATLLAHKWLALTVNPTSSHLGIATTCEQLTPQPKLLSRQYVSRASSPLPEVLRTKLPPLNLAAPLTLSKGDTCRWSIYNYGDEAVNVLALAWDSHQGLLLLPLQSHAWQLELAAGLRVPLYTWTLSHPCHWLQVFIISSRRAFNAIDQHRPRPSTTEPLLLAGEESLTLIQHLLSDLSTEPDSNDFSLDVSQWCTQSYTLRVV
ncbi:caspase family protein [Thermosynechococcaceae cyanobacterium Okahandja]